MPRLILIYNLFITTLFTVSGLAQAQNLNQVGFALLFAPLAIYFFRRIVSNWLPQPQSSIVTLPLNPNPNPTGTTIIQGEELSAHEVSDINRRLFLKLIGTAGLTTFLFALFTKSSQAAFFGSVPGPGTVALKDTQGNKIDPAEKGPTDGYEVCDIDDSSSPAYYGFINKDGAWYIAREGSTGEYRYRRGSGSFTASWDIHTSLSYGYFNDVF